MGCGTVGAIQESPAAPLGQIPAIKQKDQLPSYHVIARRAKPDVAIRILSGAKHRPSPMGTERERIDTSLRSSQ